MQKNTKNKLTIEKTECIIVPNRSYTWFLCGEIYRRKWDAGGTKFKEELWKIFSGG